MQKEIKILLTFCQDTRDNDDDRHGALADDYVNFLATAAIPKATTLAEIKAATTQDASSELLFNRRVQNKLLQFASVTMTTSKPHNPEKVKENDSRS